MAIASIDDGMVPENHQGLAEFACSARILLDLLLNPMSSIRRLVQDEEARGVETERPWPVIQERPRPDDDVPPCLSPSICRVISAAVDRRTSRPSPGRGGELVRHLQLSSRVGQRTSALDAASTRRPSDDFGMPKAVVFPGAGRDSTIRIAAGAGERDGARLHLGRLAYPIARETSGSGRGDRAT